MDILIGIAAVWFIIKVVQIIFGGFSKSDYRRDR